MRPGGALVLELGGDEADLLVGDLAAAGFADVAVLTDEDGDVRGDRRDVGDVRPIGSR